MYDNLNFFDEELKYKKHLGFEMFFNAFKFTLINNYFAL